MNNGNNAAQGKHLESIAAATKRYILAEILDVTNTVADELENFSGAGVLDTVPATVDGGLWFELENDLPSVIKLKHGAHTLTLTPTIINVSPGLTVTPSASTIPADGSITAAVSYLGTGAITVSGTNGVTPSYDSSTKIITVPYSYDADSSTITVSLAAAYGYLADEKTFSVSMEKISPNLTVTPSANTTDGDDITASVSYSGGGTLSVSSDNANVTPTVSGSTITVPYYAFTDADTTVTITVSVAANGSYNAQSHSFQILYEQCQELDPQLTLTRKVYLRGSEGGDTEGSYDYAVSYLGNGTITVDDQSYPHTHVGISYNATTNILTIESSSGYSGCGTVSLSASPPYVASTVTIPDCGYGTPPDTFYGVPATS